MLNSYKGMQKVVASKGPAPPRKKKNTLCAKRYKSSLHQNWYKSSIWLMSSVNSIFEKRFLPKLQTNDTPLS